MPNVPVATMTLLANRWRRLVARPTRLKSLQPSEAWLAAPSDETWWAIDFPADAPQVTISGAVRGPVSKYPKALVARLRYLAEDGEAVEFKPRRWSRSKAAGTYKYLEQVQQQDRFTLEFEIAPGAKSVHLCFQKWRRSAPDAFAVRVEAIQHASAAQPQSGTRRPDKELERVLNRMIAKAGPALDFRGAPPLFPDQLPLTEAVTEAYVQRSGSSKLANSLGRRWLKAGRSLDVARIASYARDPRVAREVGRLDLLKFVRAQAPRPTPPQRLKRRGILYLLHNCRPYDSGGYASRAQGLLTGFLQNGWSAQAIARLGYPWDRKPEVTDAPRKIKIGEVEYCFLNNLGSIDQGDQIRYVQDYADAVLSLVNTQDVGIVIAPSFYNNAFAGRIIADALGVPLVYEMRGLHWFTVGSQKDWWKASDQGRMMRDLEIEAAKKADMVFTITASLKAWLESYDIPGPVHVLPNGCFAEDAEPEDTGPPLREQLAIPQEAFVVGYIGSLAYYEGIERLIEAIHKARHTTGRELHLLLVGDGPHRAQIEKAHAALGSPNYIHIAGRVSPEHIGACYAAVDVIALPREDFEVCHIISPLKPLETMLMQKPMIASNVRAMKEIIEPSNSGLLFPAGDTEALAGAIAELSAAPERCRVMAKDGHAWALGHRTWESVARDGCAAILNHLPLETEAHPCP